MESLSSCCCCCYMLIKRLTVAAFTGSAQVGGGGLPWPWPRPRSRPGPRDRAWRSWDPCTRCSIHQSWLYIVTQLVGVWLVTVMGREAETGSDSAVTERIDNIHQATDTDTVLRAVMNTNREKEVSVPQQQKRMCSYCTTPETLLRSEEPSISLCICVIR